MTEIQRTNIRFAEFAIDQLYKPKPFDLVLGAGDTGSLHNIASEFDGPFSASMAKATEQRVKNGTGVSIEINTSNCDGFYHMLSSYVAKYGLSESAVLSLGEVS